MAEQKPQLLLLLSYQTHLHFLSLWDFVPTSIRAKKTRFSLSQFVELYPHIDASE
jgi:hypothetical protein